MRWLLLWREKIVSKNSKTPDAQVVEVAPPMVTQLVGAVILEDHPGDKWMDAEEVFKTDRNVVKSPEATWLTDLHGSGDIGSDGVLVKGSFLAIDRGNSKPVDGEKSA